MQEALSGTFCGLLRHHRRRPNSSKWTWEGPRNRWVIKRPLDKARRRSFPQWEGAGTISWLLQDHRQRQGRTNVLYSSHVLFREMGGEATLPQASYVIGIGRGHVRYVQYMSGSSMHRAKHISLFSFAGLGEPRFSCAVTHDDCSPPLSPINAA